ncbi:MAG: Uma2 family endonuclease [Pyrinomonadaceae bacterium]
MTTKTRATILDLYQVPGNQKAEIINGEIVLMSPTGSKPGRAAMKIVTSLSRYEEEHAGGYAFGDNVGFRVNLPNRDSFSPDAAWYVGDIESMDFLEGAPAFAVEVRSKNDYGPKAEQAVYRKLKDYFAARTKVVWDVDLFSESVIKVYRATDPDNPTLYSRRDIAEAEPAVPGWGFSVDELFK